METADLATGASTPPEREIAKRRVRAWMIQTGRSYATLAGELGISPGHLQTVTYGLKGCSTALALRWARLSKLPISTILALRRTDPERRRSGWKNKKVSA